MLIVGLYGCGCLHGIILTPFPRPVLCATEYPLSNISIARFMILNER
jgi:hypothetical protein